MCAEVGQTCGKSGIGYGSLSVHGEKEENVGARVAREVTFLISVIKVDQKPVVCVGGGLILSHGLRRDKVHLTGGCMKAGRRWLTPSSSPGFLLCLADPSPWDEIAQT